MLLIFILLILTARRRFNLFLHKKLLGSRLDGVLGGKGEGGSMGAEIWRCLGLMGSD